MRNYKYNLALPLCQADCLCEKSNTVSGSEPEIPQTFFPSSSGVRDFGMTEKAEFFCSEWQIRATALFFGCFEQKLCSEFYPLDKGFFSFRFYQR